MSGNIISIGNQVFSITEFQTVLFEVADLLNERPIGRNPTHPDDDFHLCPNNLLFKRSSNGYSPSISSPNHESARHFLVKTFRKMADQFLEKNGRAIISR